MQIKVFLGALAASVYSTTQVVKAAKSEVVLEAWWDVDENATGPLMMAQINTEPEAQPETEPAAESDAEAEAESAAESAAETDSEAEAESETEAATEQPGLGPMKSAKISGPGAPPGGMMIYTKKILKPPVDPITALAKQSKRDRDAMLRQKSGEMKKALMEIPYLKQVLMGGELAKMAFDYMKANAPLEAKNAANTIWQEKIAGRFKAFKGWLKEAWSGKSGLTDVIGSYLDYLALFNPAGDKEEPVSLRLYFDSTRCANDRGNYDDYQKIINRLGMTADKKLYRDLRKQSRNEAYDKRLDQTSAKIDKLGKAIADKQTTSPLPNQCSDEYLAKIAVHFDGEFDESVDEIMNMEVRPDGKLKAPKRSFMKKLFGKKK